MSVFWKRKWSKKIQIEAQPTETGIQFSGRLIDGEKVVPLTLPLAKEEIQNYYKLEGFSQYVFWEELYEADLLNDGKLTYEKYYEMIEQKDADGDTEYGQTILQGLGLPVEPEPVNGVLSLRSLPEQAELSLTLRNQRGENLDRIGQRIGAMYRIGTSLRLLPNKVYQLIQAMTENYEHGYQKIAVCQQLAREAGIQLESFLEKEQYHIVDTYDLSVKVHGPDHIELVPVGRTEWETKTLQSAQPIASFKDPSDPEKRIRYSRTKRVSQDLQKLAMKRHLYGEEVPIFLQNPAAVLPEHDYLIDLKSFSDRVKGIIPLHVIRCRPSRAVEMEWFATDDETIQPYDESFIKDLMQRYPDQQFVLENGQWYYLDPSLRKQLFQDESTAVASKERWVLDIKDNEKELEYLLQTAGFRPAHWHPLPQGLQASLYEHQVVAYQWLCHLREAGRGGLLADDMGLGKTLEVIAFLLRQQELGKIRPSLVVLPPALIHNWLQEMACFAPNLYRGAMVHLGPRRLRSAEALQNYDLILTSYDTLKYDQLILGKIHFQCIICDEAQFAKDHTSLRSRALRAMQGDFRLAMTGTPVETRLEELWTIMDYVQPGHFGALKEFRRKYVENENFDELMRELKPFYLRRTKEEVLKDKLPAKYICDPIYVEASEKQKQLTLSMLKSQEKNVLNVLTKLRQLYGHPGAVVPHWSDLPVDDVPKLKVLLQLLDKIREKQEKAIIYTEFRKVQHILKHTLMRRYGITVPIIDGDTDNRPQIVELFNSQPGFGVMIISPRAGGVGLTITSANHVIHYTRWWNPALENQATDRVYRIGQEKEVYVYHIITTDKQYFPNGTVEEKMHALLESRRELAENVLIPFDYKQFEQQVLHEILASFKIA